MGDRCGEGMGVVTAAWLDGARTHNGIYVFWYYGCESGLVACGGGVGLCVETSWMCGVYGRMGAVSQRHRRVCVSVWLCVLDDVMERVQWLCVKCVG